MMRAISRWGSITMLCLVSARRATSFLHVCRQSRALTHRRLLHIQQPLYQTPPNKNLWSVEECLAAYHSKTDKKVIFVDGSMHHKGNRKGRQELVSFGCWILLLCTYAWCMSTYTWKSSQFVVPNENHSISRFNEGPRIPGAHYFDMDDIATSKELFPDLNPKGLHAMFPPEVCKLSLCRYCYLLTYLLTCKRMKWKIWSVVSLDSVVVLVSPHAYSGSFCSYHGRHGNHESRPGR